MEDQDYEGCLSVCQHCSFWYVKMLVQSDVQTLKEFLRPILTVHCAVFNPVWAFEIMEKDHGLVSILKLGMLFISNLSEII